MLERALREVLALRNAVHSGTRLDQRTANAARRQRRARKRNTDGTAADDDGLERGLQAKDSLLQSGERCAKRCTSARRNAGRDVP